MKWIYDDGGRSKYFRAKNVRDCAVRAIAIATGKDYLEVYNALKALNKGKSCRNGTPKNVGKKYLKSIGWTWNPTMEIGKGCRVHLDENELPNGTLIVQIAGHLTCVIDGVIYDTFNCSLTRWDFEFGMENSRKCVYGYWSKQ